MRNWLRMLRLAGAVTAVAAGGCAVQRAHTVPFTPQDNKGLVYSVPKTYLSISLTYTRVTDELRPAQMETAHLVAVDTDQSPIRMTAVAYPDEQATFLVKTDELLSNVMFLSSISFSFNNGMLAAVDAASVDRTGEILEELGTTAVNISKALAKGGDNATPHEKAIRAAELRIDEIYAAIAKASSTPVDPGQPNKSLDNLQKELSTMRALIKDLRTNLDPPVRTVTATVTVLIDPDKPTRVTPDYMEYELRPQKMFAEVPAENMDVVFIRVYDDHRREFAGMLHGANRPTDVPGILYRQPVRLVTKVCVGRAGDEGEPAEVFSGLVPYLQFSPPAVAVLTSKVMTAKHTTLVMDPATGGLVSYGVAQDSAIERAAQAAADTSAAADRGENAGDSSRSGGSGKKGGTSSGSGKSGSSSSGKTSSGTTATPKSLTDIPAIETISGASTNP